MWRCVAILNWRCGLQKRPSLGTLLPSCWCHGPVWGSSRPHRVSHSGGETKQTAGLVTAIMLHLEMSFQFKFVKSDLQIKAGALGHGGESTNGRHGGEGTHQHEDAPAVELVGRAHLETPSYESRHKREALENTGSDLRPRSDSDWWPCASRLITKQISSKLEDNWGEPVHWSPSHSTNIHRTMCSLVKGFNAVHLINTSYLNVCAKGGQRYREMRNQTNQDDTRATRG